MAKPYNYMWISPDGTDDPWAGILPEYPASLDELSLRAGFLESEKWKVVQVGSSLSFGFVDVYDEYHTISIEGTDLSTSDIHIAMFAYNYNHFTVMKVTAELFIFEYSNSSKPGTLVQTGDDTVERIYEYGLPTVGLVKSGDYTLSAPVDLYGGSVAKNHPCMVIGYHESFDEEACVSDLDNGQAFYESAIDTYKHYDLATHDFSACVAATNCPVISGLESTFTVDNTENALFKNIAFAGAEHAIGRTTSNLVFAGSLTVLGCKFFNLARVFNGLKCTGVMAVIECFDCSGGGGDVAPLRFKVETKNALVSHTVIVRKDAQNGALQSGVRSVGGGGTFINNIVIGGSHSIDSPVGLVANNIFIEPTVAFFVSVYSCEVSPVLRNNIFIGHRNGQTFLAEWDDECPQIPAEDYNWYFNLAGKLFGAAAEVEDLFIGSNSLWNVADPMIDSVEDGDFRALNREVFTAGSFGIDGRAGFVGPLAKKERASRWQVANMARMAVIR